MRISFDLDGVLVDMSTAAIRAIEKWAETVPEMLRPQRPTAHKEWSFLDVLTQDQWDAVFSYMMAQEDAWLQMPAHHENVAALRAFRSRRPDVRIFYITARPQSAGASTVIQSQLWLMNHGLKPNLEDVIVCESGSQKPRIIKENGIQYSLDDLASTVRLCQCIDGHRAYLQDMPYNRDSFNFDLPRVESVSEFLTEVELAQAASETVHV